MAPLHRFILGTSDMITKDEGLIGFQSIVFNSAMDKTMSVDTRKC